MIIIEPTVWLFRANEVAIFRNPPVNRIREVRMTIFGLVETVFIFILTGRWQFYYLKWFSHYRTAIFVLEEFFSKLFHNIPIKKNYSNGFLLFQYQKKMFKPNSHYSNRFSFFEWILFEWNYSNVYIVSDLDSLPVACPECNPNPYGAAGP